MPKVLNITWSGTSTTTPYIHKNNIKCWIMPTNNIRELWNFCSVLILFLYLIIYCSFFKGSISLENGGRVIVPSNIKFIIHVKFILFSYFLLLENNKLILTLSGFFLSNTKNIIYGFNLVVKRRVNLSWIFSPQDPVFLVFIQSKTSVKVSIWKFENKKDIRLFIYRHF